MQRVAVVGISVVTVAVLVGLAGAFPATGAQGDDSQLRTAVAGLQTRTAGLEARAAAAATRVAGLEARVVLLEAGTAGGSAPPTATPMINVRVVEAGEDAAAAPGRDLPGSLTIFLGPGGAVGDDPLRPGAPCSGADSGSPRTDDGGVREGARIAVRDGAGAVVATSTLGPGEVVERPGEGGTRHRVCRFPFVVEDLPRADAYAVAIAGLPDEVTVPYEVLMAGGWRLDLDLS